MKREPDRLLAGIAILALLIASIASARTIGQNYRLNELERKAKITVPPCECQVEPEAELDLPTPRFPRGVVR